MAVNGIREIKEHLKIILFPKCSLSWDCAFEFEAACITAVASRRLQTEAERTPGLSKAKTTTAFMHWWLWQVEPLIPDHRLHSSDVPKQNREGFWPSPRSRSARVRNPRWPGVDTRGLVQEGRGERASCSILCRSRSRALGATASAATLGLWILSRGTLCWGFVSLRPRREGMERKDLVQHKDIPVLKLDQSTTYWKRTEMWDQRDFCPTTLFCSV